MRYEEVFNTAEFILKQTTHRPKVAIVLGSGLGGLVDTMQDCDIISYNDIPGFPRSNVAGHAARLVLGRIGGCEVAAMQGRFHYYEGFSMQQLTFPIFVLKAMGIRDLILTNACGGINTELAPGDLMLITDHINLLGDNPLIGANDERFGPRFPDMTEVYSKKLLEKAQSVASALDIPVKKGVYALFSGPCYETAAEIRAYHTLGADAIGMSTVPEATAAHYLGMRVLGISCITNMATGIAKTKHSHEAVLAIANASSMRFCRLMETLIAQWNVTEEF